MAGNEGGITFSATALAHCVTLERQEELALSTADFIDALHENVRGMGVAADERGTARPAIYAQSLQQI